MKRRDGSAGAGPAPAGRRRRPAARWPRTAGAAWTRRSRDSRSPAPNSPCGSSPRFGRRRHSDSIARRADTAPWARRRADFASTRRARVRRRRHPGRRLRCRRRARATRSGAGVRARRSSAVARRRAECSRRRWWRQARRRRSGGGGRNGTGRACSVRRLGATGASLWAPEGRLEHTPARTGSARAWCPNVLAYVVVGRGSRVSASQACAACER